MRLLRGEKIKILRAGSTGRRFHIGPCMAQESYKTLRGGWSDAIQCGAGEVVACINGGNVYEYARWIVGPVADVTSHLRALGYDEESRARYNRLAEEIDAAVGNIETPAALLAHVLGISRERIAEACAIAGVTISRNS